MHLLIIKLVWSNPSSILMMTWYICTFCSFVHLPILFWLTCTGANANIVLNKILTKWRVPRNITRSYFRKLINESICFLFYILTTKQFFIFVWASEILNTIFWKLLLCCPNLAILYPVARGIVHELLYNFMNSKNHFRLLTLRVHTRK